MNTSTIITIIALLTGLSYILGKIIIHLIIKILRELKK